MDERNFPRLVNRLRTNKDEVETKEQKLAEKEAKRILAGLGR